MKKLLTLFAALVFSGAAAATEQKEVLNNWFALGSGCRARHDLAGDVKLEKFQEKKDDSEVYGAKIYFEKFQLSSDTPSLRSPLLYGKECSVRININPPPGKRLKRLIAVSNVAASKNADSDLLLNGELKLGTLSLGNERLEYEKARVLDREVSPIFIDTQLAKLKGTEEMPVLGCGEAKIIGFDFTFVSQRETEQSKFKAELADGNPLEIRAELENCL